MTHCDRFRFSSSQSAVDSFFLLQIAHVSLRSRFGPLRMSLVCVARSAVMLSSVRPGSAAVPAAMRAARANIQGCAALLAWRAASAGVWLARLRACASRAARRAGSVASVPASASSTGVCGGLP